MYKRRIGGRVTYIGKAAWLALKNAVPTAGPVPTPSVRQMPGSTDIDPQTQWADMTDPEARILRASMKQTGDEAGRPRRYMGDPNGVYIQTSKSYLINNALRNGMTSITDGYMTDGAWHWVNMGYTLNDAKNAVRSIDSGMKPLTKAIKVERYEGLSAINTLLQQQGLSVSRLRGMSQQQIDDLLVGKSRPSKTYVSTSWRMDNTQRDQRYKSSPVKIEYTLGKGVDAIVTNNVGEHEIVAGRGYRETIVGAKFSPSGQLILRVNINANDRPDWYKV